MSHQSLAHGKGADVKINLGIGFLMVGVPLLVSSSLAVDSYNLLPNDSEDIQAVRSRNSAQVFLLALAAAAVLAGLGLVLAPLVEHRKQ